MKIEPYKRHNSTFTRNCTYYITVSEKVPTLAKDNQKAFDSLMNYHKYPYIYSAELSGFNLDTVFDLE